MLACEQEVALGEEFVCKEELSLKLKLESLELEMSKGTEDEVFTLWVEAKLVWPGLFESRLQSWRCQGQRREDCNQNRFIVTVFQVSLVEEVSWNEVYRKLRSLLGA